MTAPNLLSILRILLVPVFMIYMLNNRMLASLIVFLIAGISDALDGFIVGMVILLDIPIQGLIDNFLIGA